MTLPAHTSILTGRTPRTHGVHDNGTFRLDDRVPTLATVLQRAGYRTGAFVGAFVLDARFGLSRGFDEYDDRYPHEAEGTTFRFSERRAAEVVKAAGDWILRRRQPPVRVPGSRGSISSIRTRRTTRPPSIAPAGLPTTRRSHTRTRCSDASSID